MSSDAQRERNLSACAATNSSGVTPRSRAARSTD